MRAKGQHTSHNGFFEATKGRDMIGSGPNHEVGIDPAEMTGPQLCGALDELVSRTKSGKSFGSLVSALRKVNKVNPHQHITGSIGQRELLEQVVRVYRADPEVRERLLDYTQSQGLLAHDARDQLFDMPDSAIAEWLEKRIPLRREPGEFAESDRHLNMARLAFNSSNPEAITLFRQAYRQVAMENFEDGVTEVWLRTTMGDQSDGTFARAALEGARHAERETGENIQVRFMVGMRKHVANNRHADASQNSGPQDRISPVNPLSYIYELAAELGPMIIGVDSVGVDSGWIPEQQESLRSNAARRHLRVAVHCGESWHEGGLVQTLEGLKELTNNGVLNHLDNANALFAAPDPSSAHQHYSEAEWNSIAELQWQVFASLTNRGIALGINPTSNDWLTRKIRRQEGWRFRNLAEPFWAGAPSVIEMMNCEDDSASRLRLVVGNDNSRIYPSRIEGDYLTVSEELASLWSAPGRSNDSNAHVSTDSVYGTFPTATVARLIKNGSELIEAGSNQAAARLAS